MTEDFKNWTKYDFLAFVLIEASFADKLIQEDEKDVISKIVSIERFYKILDFYRNNNSEQNKEVMLSLKDKFVSTSSQKDELREKIEELLKSDSQFSQREKEVQQSLDEIFR